MIVSFLPLLALSIAILMSIGGTANAISFTNFAEYGQSVNGYQDDFLGSTLSPDWDEIGAGHFTLSGSGILNMLPAAGDPNKLLFNPTGGYNNTTQNVLALVRKTGGISSTFRGGVTASSVPGGQGFNLLYVNADAPGTASNRFALLDDGLSWGPTTPDGAWATNDWNWLRLTTDGTTVQGKVWSADNITPEPGTFNLSWTRSGRSGLAGLTTNSIDGDGTFEVDYALIQASNLPTISAGTIATASVASQRLATGNTFTTVPNPSSSDLAQTGVFSTNGTPHSLSGPPTVLQDGVISNSDNAPPESFFADSGTFRISLDMGSLVDIEEINTYSACK